MSEQRHQRPGIGSAQPGPGGPAGASPHAARLDVTYGYSHLHEELDADLEQMATRPAAPPARPALSERAKLGLAAGVWVLAALLLTGVLTGQRRAALPATAPMADTMAADAGGNGVPDPSLPAFTGTAPGAAPNAAPAPTAFPQPQMGLQPDAAIVATASQTATASGWVQTPLAAPTTPALGQATSSAPVIQPYQDASGSMQPDAGDGDQGWGQQPDAGAGQNPSPLVSQQPDAGESPAYGSAGHADAGGGAASAPVAGGASLQPE